ncbi:hypothetical protein [Chryseobacterium indoltheticum]
MYSEHEKYVRRPWNLENSNGDPVPDDFINAMVMQATYLEEEIED